MSRQQTKNPPFSATERLDDEFYYGYRTIISYDDEGKEIYSYQPLTLDDFLDPQEGDLLMQGTLHQDDVEQLKEIFRYVYRHDEQTTVFSDLKILWGIKGLKQPAPDVMIIPHVHQPEKPRPSFDVVVEGTRPVFVLEVVSPRYRKPDRDDKVAIYEQAGVEEYIIIDSWLKDDGTVNYEILGYRLQGGIYTQIQPDDRGWLFSSTTQVWLAVNESRDQFMVINAQTGDRILPDRERAEVAEAHKLALEAQVAELELLVQQLQNQPSS